jgi:uncharacterized protein
MTRETSMLEVVIADRFVTRLRGRLGQPCWPQNRALWLIPCRAVHTLGMAVPIDVVFLRRDGAVLRVISALAPNRVAWCWSAHSVLELAAGGADSHRLTAGRRWPNAPVHFRRWLS